MHSTTTMGFFEKGIITYGDTHDTKDETFPNDFVNTDITEELNKKTPEY
jgi:hypothetical protein